MSEWRNYHIYYTDLDRLILESVYPLLKRREHLLETCFFERHYAGGTHLKVRLRGDADEVNEVGSELVREVETYLSVSPSAPVSDYSPQLAKKLLELEDEPSEPDDLVYRVNEILKRPYQRLNHRLASNDAVALLEDFLHDVMPLAVMIIEGPRPKQEQLLRLYFLKALNGSSGLPGGSVSYKSHWEGLALNHSTPKLTARIKATYEPQSDKIRQLMLEVKERFESNTLSEDPVLDAWHILQKHYRERAVAILESGKHVTFQYGGLDQVRHARQDLKERMMEDSPFLRELYSDERFMASFQYETGMLLPRVITNLLYSVLPLVGLTAIDKMALCYYSHKAVEDHFDCDLTEILRETIKKVVERNQHRFVSP